MIVYLCIHPILPDTQFWPLGQPAILKSGVLFKAYSLHIQANRNTIGFFFFHYKYGFQTHSITPCLFHSMYVAVISMSTKKEPLPSLFCLHSIQFY